MQGIAEALDEGLNGKDRPKKVAFVVLTANFGDYAGGRVNYVSNAEREDIKVMLKELLARWEGRYDEAPGTRQ
jgi:hypothetical protein